MTRRLPALALLTVLAVPAGAQTAFFNDPTDTIQVDGQTVINSACTYEAVVLFPSGVAAGGLIYNEWVGFQEDKYLYAGFQSSGPSVVQGYNHPGGTVLQGSSPIPPDVWHHVAFVYDGSEERLYVDVALIASRAISFAVANATGFAHIGAIHRDGTINHGLIGYLESVRLSNVARYSGASFPPPLGDLTSDANTVLLFNFTEPAGSATVQDLSPLARVGTLGAGFGGATPPLLGPVVAAEPGPERGLAALRPPMPSPATGMTTIRYELGEPADVTLAVYDALGRVVTELVAGDRPAGLHTVMVDVSPWTAGVYVVRLSAGDAVVASPLFVRR